MNEGDVYYLHVRFDDPSSKTVEKSMFSRNCQLRACAVRASLKISLSPAIGIIPVSYGVYILNFVKIELKLFALSLKIEKVTV